MSTPTDAPSPPPEEQLPPEEEAEMVRRADEAPENVRTGNMIPWDELEGIVLDPEEEAEILRREAEIPELDRQGALRPIGELLDELRAEVGQRRAG